MRSVLLAGLALLTLGLLFFTRVSPHGTYLGDLAPGFVLAGIGLGFAFIPVTIAALMGISDDEAGLASGLINTSQQIGGAVGVALLATVFTSRTAEQAKAGVAADTAFTDGLSRAFLVGAVMAVIALAATFVLVREGRGAEAEAPAAVRQPADGRGRACGFVQAARSSRSRSSSSGDVRTASRPERKRNGIPQATASAASTMTASATLPIVAMLRDMEVLADRGYLHLGRFALREYGTPLYDRRGDPQSADGELELHGRRLRSSHRMSAAFGGLESPAVCQSGAAVLWLAGVWAPDRQTCGDPGPAQRAERAQGLRGSGSRLSKGFQPDLRAGIRSRSLRAPRPLTLIL